MATGQSELAPGRPPLGPADQPKLERLRERLQELNGEPGLTLEALCTAQEIFDYLPPEAISMIAETLAVPESEVYGVATFYAMLYLAPQPKYILRVCRDLSCHLVGASEVIQAIREELGLHGEEISPDGLFKLEPVSCPGLCDKQPAMLVNLERHGPLTPEGAKQLIRELRSRET